MCGIAGIIGPSALSSQASQERLKAMTDSLRHRGPDGEGRHLETTGSACVALGHRRLSIIDPTPASAQPLSFLDRYVISHNGEIYNAPQLRAGFERKGLSFRSRGDAEVIAAAYHLRREACAEDFDGMFAFALWDREEETLFCARDRFGEKPFHYHYDEEKGLLSFASEMKALWAGGIPRIPKPHAFLHFLTLGITEHPGIPELTFYDGILRLPPAHYLHFHPASKQLTISRYWDLDKLSCVNIDPTEAVRQFSKLFEDSLASRLQADVRIGLTLSGGIDSGAIASGCFGKVTDSVSAVFPGFIRDESKSIARMAALAGLQSHLVEPNATMLEDGMDTLAYHQEEPFGSSGILAQFAVHQLAADQGIRVLLDGQGADETLGGYDRYAQWYLHEVIRNKGWRQASVEAKALAANGFLPEWGRRHHLAAYAPGLTSALLERKTHRLHAGLSEINDQFRDAYSGAGFIQKPLVDRLNDILYADTLGGPLQTLLRYADRNAMAHSIESRFPFLQHELVEFIFSLPPSLKFREGFSKWILRENCRSRVPEDITWPHGKTGFEPPQSVWMKNKNLQRSIRAAQEKLTDLNILKPAVLNRPVAPCNAYARDNRDWRYWVTAQFL